MPELNHIRWTRLENQRPRRPRGRGGPRIQVPSDRTQHGESVLESAMASIERVEQKSRELGVDPNNLLVLRLTFLVDDLVETLSKLGAFLVQEKAEHLGQGRPNVYRVAVQFITNKDLRRFMVALHCYKDRLILLNSVPNWLQSYLSQFSASLRMDLSEQFEVPYVYQLSSNEKIEQFETLMGRPESRTRFSYVQATEFLTLAERRDLGNALQSVEHINREDRMGARLRLEGIPETGCFYLDVDLWHPGSYDAATQVFVELDKVVNRYLGKLTDKLRTESMLLARVNANRELLNALLELNIVSRVDLKPKSPGEVHNILQQVDFSGLPEAPEYGPLAAVIDSGVVSGHDFLAGWVVDSVDFESGDDTDVDLFGHGTQVAGIVMYGDIANCLRTGSWEPKVKVCSGKVLNRNNEFSDSARAETQIRDAIEYFVREYDCRIFNLSIGNLYNVFDGSHQLPWAHMLDELAYQHKLVIVVSAGNVSDPEIPNALNEEDFRREVRDQLYGEDHRIIDPGTAALALTIGSVARRDDPMSPYGYPHEGDRPPVTASLQGHPSPFTRTGFDFGQPGTGISKQIKPELSAYGGNYSLLKGGNQWVKIDRNLGEPVLRHDISTGRPVTVACGTSIAAPQVTHMAAIIEYRLREQGVPPEHRINMVRALLVHAAKVDSDVFTWLTGELTTAQAEKVCLRVMGYGLTDVTRASFSDEGRAVLVGYDTLPLDQIHLYELYIPKSFIDERGNRSLKVTLAYDPPTRGTRKEYVSRTMWFQMIRGLTSQEVFQYMSRASGSGDQPRIPNTNLLKASPSYTSLQWSTVQSAEFKSTRGNTFNYPIDDEVMLHILVGCQSRFSVGGIEDETQNYALVASLEHDADDIRLHQAISNRITQRVRVRPRR